MTFIPALVHQPEPSEADMLMEARAWGYETIEQWFAALADASERGE